MVVATNNTGNFDHHVDAVLRCRVHCPMENILGFSRSLAPAAAMVDEFVA
jgi:hypothetical protein